jgi:sugar-specific transcriptional regulator TrmB
MQTLLQQLGLTDKEAQIYMALLSLGSASVQKIAQLADIKRVTAYVILNQLLEKGLAVAQTEQKVRYFQVVHPAALEKLLEIKLKEVEAQRAVLKGSMGHLEALYNFRQNKPHIRFFEGRDGLEELEKYGHDHMAPGSVMMAVTPRDLIEEAFPKHRKNEVANRVLKGILSQTIYVADKEIPIEQNIQELRNGIHFTRKELPIEGTLFIYPGWGVKFFNYNKRKYYGILIQSAEFADSMKEIFALAWEGAQVRKVRGK